MATYVVGDIQGCFDTFMSLLLSIKFKPWHDKLILLGDVINRGPKSLEVLKYIIKYQQNITMILGNHEIFALALKLGATQAKSPPAHTLDRLIKDPDASNIFNWLKERPVIIKEQDNIFVHAGILPNWSLDHALALGEEIHEKLAGFYAQDFLRDYFERPTNNKDPELCLALASFTRIRMCASKSIMDLSYSGTPENAPKGLKPWFMLRDDRPTNIFFGHWAALGFYNYNNYYCLDSGCVWGRTLSALCLEDRVLYQVDNCELR